MEAGEDEGRVPKPEATEYDDIFPEEVSQGPLGVAEIVGLLVVVAVIGSVAIALVWLQHR